MRSSKNPIKASILKKSTSKKRAGKHTNSTTSHNVRHITKTNKTHKKKRNKIDDIKFKYNELASGTKIIQIHSKHSNYVAIEAYINYGSSLEPSNKKGISHLVEHLIFRMNTKLTDTKLTLKDFLREKGIYYNAYTSRKTVMFYLSGDSSLDNFNRMFYVLREQLYNFSITKAEFEIERDIVIQELYKGQDDSSNDKWNLINGHYFKNHPLCETIIGTVETIKSITIEDIMDYYHKVFVPSNFTIYVNGKIPEFDSNKPAGIISYYLLCHTRKNNKCPLWTNNKKLPVPFNSKNIVGVVGIPEINKKLTDLRRQDKIFTPHIPPKCTEVIKFNKPGLKQSHIAILFPTTGLYNPNKHLVAGISHILTNGQYGKIYETIRNKYGLSYNILIGTFDTVECGYLYISINVNKDKTDFALKTLKDLILRAQKPGFITKEELEVYIKGVRSEHDALLNSDGISHFSNRISDYREIHNIEDFYKKYYDITLEAINCEAAELLNLDRALIYTYG